MIPAHRFDHLHGAAREAAIEQADAAERVVVAQLAELERLALGLALRDSVSATTAATLGGTITTSATAATLFDDPREGAFVTSRTLNRAERRAAARRASR